MKSRTEGSNNKKIYINIGVGTFCDSVLRKEKKIVYIYNSIYTYFHI